MNTTIPTLLLSCAALFAPAQRVAAQEAARSLATAIEEVTVYADGARVLRKSGALDAGGRLVVADLPATLDPEHVRVRCTGGHVVGVEVRERVSQAAADPRTEALRAAVAAKRAEITAAEDERTVLARLERQLSSLLAEAGPAAAPPDGGAPLDPAEARALWARAHALLGEELAANLGAQRELGRRVEGLIAELADLSRELARIDGGGGVRTHEVEVELELRAAHAPVLELEYLVSGAGWQPEYELRTAGDARHVKLVHRARVRQATGEAWRDVAVALSTASPRRGAQGPEPEPRWIDRVQPRARALYDSGLVEAESADFFAADAEATFGAERNKAPAEPAPFASVQSAGLSLLYHLPRRETLLSRDEATVVLVGEASLAVEPEHYCAPKVSETVWLRGRSKNTSEWTLLPGSAAVFFGDDYLGRSSLGPVQRGEELVLHLGAVAALRAERVETREETRGPGFLGSKRTLARGWRVRVENHGARVAEPDGSVPVIVREAIPRSNDSRVDVSLEESSPEPSKDPRWQGEREELGLYTWVLDVPRGGAAQLEVELEISYPKSLELWFD